MVIMLRASHRIGVAGVIEMTQADTTTEAQTAMASHYSQRLRRYLVSAAAQEDEDSHLQYNLARQLYGTCDFILARPQYCSWNDSRGSSMLGLVGGPGSGKTIISAFVYSQVRILAREDSPIIWLHCHEVARASRFNMLRSLTWKIIEQRPDILLRRIHDQGHYIRLFREATTFDMLWAIFMRILTSLTELWIVIDSIHDITDGKDALINSFANLLKQPTLRTRLKVVISSRHVSDFDAVTDNVIQYTAEDMSQGISFYVSQELKACGLPVANGSQIHHTAVDTINSVGGGLHWARAVLHLLKATDSEASAKQLLLKLTSQETIIRHLWEDVTGRSTYPAHRRLIWSLAEMMAMQGFTPLPVIDIYNMLSQQVPDVVHADGDLGHLGEFLRRDLAGLVCTADGRFSMPNEIRRLLRQELNSRLPPADKAESTKDPAIRHPVGGLPAARLHGELGYYFLIGLTMMYA